MFNFTQTGDEPLTTRLLGGPTAEPWDGIICRQNISEFSVCDTEQKEIWIDAEACITVNAYGQEVDIYSRLTTFWCGVMAVQLSGLSFFGDLLEDAVSKLQFTKLLPLNFLLLNL